MHKILKKEQPLVKPEASGGKNPNYRHHPLSGRITGDGTINHHQLI